MKKIRKKLWLIMVMIVLFCVSNKLGVRAAVLSEDECEYITLEDGTIAITSYFGKNEVLEIPETIDGKTVTCVQWGAFWYDGTLEEVWIPSSLVNIEPGAFYYCTNLKKITVSTDNKKYDSRNGCNAIVETAANKLVVGCQTTTFPSDVVSIGDYAFSGRENLVEIVIPKGITSIGEFAYAWCYELTRVILPEGLNELGDSAFGYCLNLKKINIPATVTQIGENCFDIKGEFPEELVVTVEEGSVGEDYVKRKGIKYETLPKQTIEEEKPSEEGKPSGEEKPSGGGVVDVTDNSLKNGDELIISGAFYKILDVKKKTVAYMKPEKKNKSSVSIGKTIKIKGTKYTIIKIADNAFKGNKKLKSVVIGGNITEIGKNAFKGCSNLSKVTIKSKKLKKVGKKAFSGISKNVNWGVKKSVMSKYRTLITKAK